MIMLCLVFLTSKQACLLLFSAANVIIVLSIKVTVETITAVLKIEQDILNDQKALEMWKFVLITVCCWTHDNIFLKGRCANL